MSSVSRRSSTELPATSMPAPAACVPIRFSARCNPSTTQKQKPPLCGGFFVSAAQRAAQLAGSHPGVGLDLPHIERRSLSVVDRQRVPFLLAQERNQRRARGASPLRPQRRLRLAFGQSRRRPATDQRTSLQQPASRRAAGAMPLPESLRDRPIMLSGRYDPRTQKSAAHPDGALLVFCNLTII